jgi:hypothetical protein
VHHTGRDLASNFFKGMAAVSVNEQEQNFQGDKKRAVQLYSSSYGGDHQSDGQGGITLIGNWVDKQDNAFGRLIKDRGDSCTRIIVSRVSKDIPEATNKYKSHIFTLLQSQLLQCHFLDAFLMDIDIIEVAKISGLGPAKAFFQKLLMRLTNGEESDFDAVCQKLNDRLITVFAKCMLVHQTTQTKCK